MKTRWILVGLAATAMFAMGQKVKSKAEGEAVNAVLTATTPDEKIAKVEALLSKYKDTEFKSLVLVQAGEAAQAKGDSVSSITYGNRALEADPKNFQAMLLVSSLLAQTTREFDLDKDDKLKRATKLANDAFPAISAAAKPNPNLTDAQWDDFKKDFTSQAHDALGVIAVIEKKWDAAINEFKMSVDGAATPDATSMVRLASAYNSAGKFTEGGAMADKAIATAGVPDAVQKVAQAEKQRAEKGKAGK